MIGASPADPGSAEHTEPPSPPVVAHLVIGCGNLLRGDDAVGPTLIRHLWDQGVPDDVELVDGGTA